MAVRYIRPAYEHDYALSAPLSQAPLAIPLAGAIAGGLIGSQVAVIGVSLGASIGWMVGSALMPKPKQKPNLIDPGYQQFVFTNQAIRGSVIPILFGTNRCTSQVVWQANATVDKSYTVQKSGGGGSGGGKGGQKTITTNYKYYIDEIFHFGMPLTPVYVFRGWIESKRMSQQTVDNINNSSNSSTVASYPDFSNLSPLLRQFFEQWEADHNAQSGTVTIYADEIIWFDGNSTSDHTAGWPWFNSQIGGGTVVWPGTAWLGMKRIALGATPAIPTISVEIGPANKEFVAGDTLVEGTDNANATNNVVGFSAYGDAIGASYLGGNNIRLLRNTGEETSYDSTTLTAGLPNGGPFGPINGLKGAGVNSDGTKLICLFGGALTWSRVCVYDIGEDQSLTLSGYLSNSSSGSTTGQAPWFDSLTQVYKIIPSGLGGDSDDLILYDNRSNRLAFNYLPSITDIVGNFNDSGGLTFEHYDSGFANFFNPGVSLGYGHYFDMDRSLGVIVPVITYDGGGAQVIDDYFVFYCPKGLMQAGGGSCTQIAAFAAANPNGCMLAIQIKDMAGGLELWNSKFVSGATSVVPFTDVWTDVDGTADTNLDYWPSNWHRTYLSNGTYAIALVKSDYNTATSGASTVTYATVRPFAWTPGSNIFSQLTLVEGPVFTHGDFSRTTGRVDTWAGGYVDTTGEQIWMVGAEYSDTYLFWAEFGSLTITSIDLTPPEIIREILAHPYFGLGYDYTQIDTTTYTASVAFCRLYEFYVSTQYRASNGGLSVIEQLLALYGGFLTVDAGTGSIKFGQQQWGGVPVRTLDNHHLLISRPGTPPVDVVKGALQDTVNKVRINYLDRTIDYKQNQVEEADEVDQDLHGVRLREFPAQFVMKQSMARSIAVRMLSQNLYMRDQYTFKLGWKDADLEPGDVVTLVDSFANINQQVRIMKWHEKKRGEFDVVAMQELQYALEATNTQSIFTANSGYNNGNNLGDARIPNYFQMYELPVNQTAGANGVLYTGWASGGNPAGAVLHLSPDNTTFQPAATGEPYDTWGRFTSALPNDATALDNVEVYLLPQSISVGSFSYWHTETIEEVSASDRAAGVSRIWVGSEMVAFEGVTLLATNHYKFTKLYRGWGGTQVSAHNSGHIWTLHNDAIELEYDQSQVGRTFWYKVVPYNHFGVSIDISSVVAKQYTIEGVHYIPQAPSDMSWVWSGDDFRGNTLWKVNTTNDITVAWKDTSRVGGYGYVGYGLGATGYGDSVTDPLSHNWRVEVYGSGGILVHSEVVTNSFFTYSRATNVAENGAWRGQLGFRLYARGSYGENPTYSVLSLNLFQ